MLQEAFLKQAGESRRESLQRSTTFANIREGFQINFSAFLFYLRYYITVIIQVSKVSPVYALGIDASGIGKLSSIKPAKVDNFCCLKDLLSMPI
jgi:hypothetical protein